MRRNCAQSFPAKVAFSKVYFPVFFPVFPPPQFFSWLADCIISPPACGGGEGRAVSKGNATCVGGVATPTLPLWYGGYKYDRWAWPSDWLQGGWGHKGGWMGPADPPYPFPKVCEWVPLNGWVGPAVWVPPLKKWPEWNLPPQGGPKLPEKLCRMSPPFSNQFFFLVGLGGEVAWVVVWAPGNLTDLLSG